MSSTESQKYVANFIGLPTDKPFHTPQEAIPLAEHCFDAGWRARDAYESVEILRLKEKVFTYTNDLEQLDKELVETQTEREKYRAALEEILTHHFYGDHSEKYRQLLKEGCL